MTTEPQDQEYASPEEARKAIEALSEADHAKLMQIGLYFVKRRLGGTIGEAEDLVQEAFVKTLAGRRRWRRGVTILKHLDRVMESESGHWAATRKRTVQPSPCPEKEPDMAMGGSTDRIRSRERLEDVLNVYAGDELALEIIRLKGLGYSVSEIQRQAGMGEVEYATVLRRIRRRFVEYSRSGGK
jgi:DNA-directed RNA polymerase specialized sigma24 family protein